MPAQEKGPLSLTLRYLPSAHRGRSFYPFINMSQFYKTLHPRWKRPFRVVGALYVAIVIWLLIARHSATSGSYLGGLTNGFHGSYSRQEVHPIERLIVKNRAHFQALEARQSRTLAAATHEYQRRYGRTPPLGFDFWFSLAQENNFVLIDEFDTLMKSIEPFHGVPTDVLQQRAKMTLEMTKDRITPLVIHNGHATIEDMLFFGHGQLPNATWLKQIPYNMTILLNSFDEAMVNAPFEDVQQALSGSINQQKCMKHPNIRLKPLVDTSHQDSWSTTASACSPNSPARQLECPTIDDDKFLTFIDNAAASKDVCQKCHLSSQHGVLLAPETSRLSHDLVPIWSASKPSHFNDILIPSPYYDAVRADYNITLDTDWSQKKDQFYWAGSATGGRATMKTWDKMQRQRLVLQTDPSFRGPIKVLEADRHGRWTTRSAATSETAGFFDTKVTRVVQCDDKACETEKKAFDLYEGKQQDPREAAYSYKFVFDIDGNAFSGRFYRLLQSKSVVVKQTIFQEWHDDRLIPWVHYVPLSTGYEELPEIARFLAGTQRGLDLSEVIARESAEWHGRALREVDLKLVSLRMFLEYGRLMNPVC